MNDQLSLFDLGTNDLTDEEREGIVRDFVSRYSDAATTNGALRPKRCRCAPNGLDFFDAAAFETRCAKCGRTP